jgi:hypothetical protein
MDSVKSSSATAGREGRSLKKRLLGWIKQGSNILSLAALVISSVIGGIALWHQLSPAPQRARFTVFLNSPAIWHNPFWENTTEIDLTGSIVNEGSLAGQIVRWGLFIDMNVSYSILVEKYELPTDLLLSPTERGNFTMQRTLTGENDTRLPDTAIRSCTAWFEYRDASGLLPTAEGQVSFLP